MGWYRVTKTINLTVDCSLNAYSPSPYRRTKSTKASTEPNVADYRSRLESRPGYQARVMLPLV